MTIKICIVGAGSKSFGRGLVNDILLSDALMDASVELHLMDVSTEGLHRISSYVEYASKKLDLTIRCHTHTDLAESLRDADFVITCLDLNKFHHWGQDYHIPRKYGCTQIFGENGNVGGIFHFLRNLGPLMDVARTMERVCPEAWLLNFSNPAFKITDALLNHSKIKVLGLCHGIGVGLRQLAALLDMPASEINAKACGINHFGWFQEITDKSTGQDLYPLLREKEKEARWLSDWDEYALPRLAFRLYGLYPYPGTNHIGEYMHWSKDLYSNDTMQFFYDPASEDPWAEDAGEFPEFVYSLERNPTLRRFYEKPEEQKQAPDSFHRTGEQAIPLIESLATGHAHAQLMVNTRNDGIIPNLPDDLTVEIPVSADANGISKQPLAPLPTAVVQMILTQMTITRLATEAWAEQSLKKLLQAVLADPSVPSYHAACHMIKELHAAQKEVLPPMHWE